MRIVTELNLISQMSRERRMQIELNMEWIFFLSQNARTQGISMRETNQITHQGASLIIQSSWRHRLFVEPIGPNRVRYMRKRVRGNRSCDPESQKSIFNL